MLLLGDMVRNVNEVVSGVLRTFYVWRVWEKGVQDMSVSFSFLFLLEAVSGRLLIKCVGAA